MRSVTKISTLSIEDPPAYTLRLTLRWASSFLSRPKHSTANAPSTTSVGLVFKPLITSQQASNSGSAIEAPLSPNPLQRQTRRRRTFARPTYADAEAPSSTPSDILAVATVPNAPQVALSSMDMASRQENSSSTRNSPATNYEEVETAILDHLDRDAATSTSITHRVSREGRFEEARLKYTVTDDDPVMKIMQRSVGDEDENEARISRAQAKKDRIRVAGTTGTGLGSTNASGFLLSSEPTISLTSSQIDAERAEMEAAAAPTVSIDQLSREQKQLLWNDRKETYSIVHRKMLIALESHHSEMDKTLLLMELHDVLIKQRLRLRPEVYVDILATAFVALTGPEHYTNNNRNRITLLEELWVMYQYCIDSGSDPTPKLIQNMMRILSLSRVADMNVETKAHRLMLDSDRFKLIPTNLCLSTYFLVCGINNAMHLAVARLVDCKTRLEVIVTTDMVKNIMEGFRRNNRCDDGLKFLTTVSNVPVTSSLLSTIVHTARGSSNPLSSFTFYKSLRQTDIKPDGRIINSLLQAQEVADDYSNTRFILSEMMRHRVRLETDPLNRMLIALEKAGLQTDFAKLFTTMRRHGKTIYLERFGTEVMQVALAFETRLKKSEVERSLSLPLRKHPSNRNTTNVNQSRSQMLQWKEDATGVDANLNGNSVKGKPSSTDAAHWRSSHSVAHQRR